MQLECPLCHRRVPVAPPESPDADWRMRCPHCRVPLVLDQYAGRLAAVKKGAVSDRAAQISRPVSAHRPGVFVGSRRSSGRDTLAAVFVAACLVAIIAGGLRLAVGFHAPGRPWSGFEMRRIVGQVEELAARFLVGRSSPRDGPTSSHLARGKILVRRESYAEGLRELDRAIEADPAEFEAHFWRGRALDKMGREEDAVAAFEAAIALNPHYSYAYDNLGWIYLRRNDHETSLAYLNQSIALRPENGWAYYNRGRIHFQMGQTEKAFQDAEDACRLGFEKACALIKRYDRKTGS